MRILWGRANSVNVMKVAWLLAELDLPCERREAGGRFGVVDTPAYRRMNPNGRVPVLEEDGFTLFESNVILRYLCATHAPDRPLWPAAPRARADVDRWMDWQQTRLNPPMTVVFQGLVRTPPERRNPAAIAAATEEAAGIWSLLDAQLNGRPCVTGPELTLADLALGPFAHRWFGLPIPRPELPHLRRWYDLLLQRPAYRDHAAREIE